MIGIQIEMSMATVTSAPKPRPRVGAFADTERLALGFITPYYTVTAWGGAYVLAGETLPVWAATSTPCSAYEELPVGTVPLHSHDDVDWRDLAEAIDRTGSVQPSPTPNRSSRHSRKPQHRRDPISLPNWAASGDTTGGHIRTLKIRKPRHCAPSVPGPT